MMVHGMPLVIVRLERQDIAANGEDSLRSILTTPSCRVYTPSFEM